MVDVERRTINLQQYQDKYGNGPWTPDIPFAILEGVDPAMSQAAGKSLRRDVTTRTQRQQVFGNSKLFGAMLEHSASNTIVKSQMKTSARRTVNWEWAKQYSNGDWEPGKLPYANKQRPDLPLDAMQDEDIQNVLNFDRATSKYLREWYVSSLSCIAHDVQMKHRCFQWTIVVVRYSSVRSSLASKLKGWRRALMIEVLNATAGTQGPSVSPRKIQTSARLRGF